jgi:hypothetical protein
VTAHTRTWVRTATAWGAITLVASAPLYHSVIWLYRTYPGAWLLLLVACVIAVASGVLAEFGPSEPEPDDVEAWRAVQGVAR